MIGVLFDTSRYDEGVTDGQVAVIDSFFDSLNWDKLDIDTTGSAALEATLDTIPLGQLMNILNTEDRWAYNGSMTTPPCDEKVYWNIVNKVYPIKEAHLNTFRYL